MVICIYVYVYILPYICMYVCMYVYYHIYIYRVGIYRSTQSSHAEVIEDCLYIARAKYLHLLQLRLVSCSLDQLVAAQISQQQLRLASTFEETVRTCVVVLEVGNIHSTQIPQPPQIFTLVQVFCAPIYIHTHIYIFVSTCKASETPHPFAV